MGMILAGVGILLTLILALLGWAYQLGFMASRVDRLQKDIDELKQRDKDFKQEINANLIRIYDKLEALPCKNSSEKEKC
jgi:hypothetical protein